MYQALNTRLLNTANNSHVNNLHVHEFSRTPEWRYNLGKAYYSDQPAESEVTGVESKRGAVALLHADAHRRSMSGRSSGRMDEPCSEICEWAQVQRTSNKNTNMTYFPLKKHKITYPCNSYMRLLECVSLHGHRSIPCTTGISSDQPDDS